MTKRITFSDEHLTFDEVNEHHEIVHVSVRTFYSNADPSRFAGYTQAELSSELEERLDEVDKSSCLSILASIEALLRIDYLQRSYEKLKDPLSRKMRDVFKEKAERASLEEDILGIWKEEIGLKAIACNAIGAFKYRHWLAHGRYWVPKIGRDYDFDILFALASEISTEFGI